MVRLLRRELTIALRARVTWFVAAAAALLVGHGFVLALDLYSASSRSALASALQAREMDPLAGIVRPTLGGLDLALTLFGPVVAARLLAVEKERRSFGALCIAEGSTGRIVFSAAIAGVAACALLLASPVIMFAGLALVGGHVDAIETGVALLGEALHLTLIVSVSIAAAAWTRTVAQAVAVGVLVSLTSWAIDAAEGFAALSWLGQASTWSIEHHLEPFQRGIVSVGAIAWLVSAAATAFALALVGVRFDWAPARRIGVASLLLAASLPLLAAEANVRRAYDWTEQRRASLPPGVVEGLRSITEPIAIEVFLDRDDSRRRQLEADVLAKLTLARPDIAVRTPLDTKIDLALGLRDTSYGRVVITVGGETRETRSTSRRELVTLLFEAAHRPTPDWSQPPYPGFPVVIDGPRRSWLVGVAYLVMPLGTMALGLWLTRRRLSR